MLSVLRNRRVRDRLSLPLVAWKTPLLPATQHVGIPRALQPLVEPVELRLQLLQRLPPGGIALARIECGHAAPRPASVVRSRRVPPPSRGPEHGASEDPTC